MLNNEIKEQTKSNRNYIWIVVIAKKLNKPKNKIKKKNKTKKQTKQNQMQNE